MKKLFIMFVILVAPVAFTACTDDATDDVQPQVVETEVPSLTEGEDAEDKGGGN